MKLPVFDGAEPLIYHRLTALGPAARRDRVLAAIEAGFNIVPYGERGDAAEMSGLAPIDIAAGDDGAVFCSPGRPFSVSAGAPDLAKAPGVAFRLSDLLSLAEVSVRPVDLQTYYFRVVQAGDFQHAFHLMQHQVPDLYDQQSYLEPMGPILRILAESIERYDATNAVLAVLGGTAASLNNVSFLSPALLSEIKTAVETAADFIETFYDEDVYNLDQAENLELDLVLDSAKANLEDDVKEAIFQGNAEWENPNILKTAEVLVWGTIPLSESVMMFDEKGFTALRR